MWTLSRWDETAFLFCSHPCCLSLSSCVFNDLALLFSMLVISSWLFMLLFHLSLFTDPTHSSLPGGWGPFHFSMILHLCRSVLVLDSAVFLSSSCPNRCLPSSPCRSPYKFCQTHTLWHYFSTAVLSNLKIDLCGTGCTTQAVAFRLCLLKSHK